MAEKNQTFVDRIRGALSRFLIGPQNAPSTESKPSDSIFGNALGQWSSYNASLASGAIARIDRYMQYKYLDQNLSEACAALNVYADNIVSGSVGGEENYSVKIDAKTPNIEEIEAVVKAAEKQTNIKDQIWDVSRALTRDGDVFTEIVIHEKNEGKDDYEVEKIKFLPTRDVEADVDLSGSFRDPKLPYFQRNINIAVDPIRFDWWRLIHWKLGWHVYGFEKSLFANASLRIGRQLIWIEEAMVIARISRAWQRFAYMIDTKNLTPDDAFVYIQRFVNRIRQKTLVDKATGRTATVETPQMPDEDIFLPTGEGAKTDIRTLGGDPNIGRILDVQYFQTKFLMSTNVPKAYVGLEEGLSGRNTLTQIDIQFGRQVRRRQDALKPGLKQFYKIVFILAGIDPDSFEWDIEFPELRTMDEMVRWEMLQTKANIAQILLTGVGSINDEYVLRELLDFDDEEIKKYASYQALHPQQPGSQGEPPMQFPPQMAQMIRRDPQVRAMLDNLKDMVTSRLKREEDAKNKVAVGIARKEPLSDKPQVVLDDYDREDRI